MDEFLTFKKMITPVIIQILFWIGVVGAVIGGIAQMGQSFIMGLLMVIIGPIAVRIYCELIIVIFSINDNLREIKKATVKDAE